MTLGEDYATTYRPNLTLNRGTDQNLVSSQCDSQLEVNHIFDGVYNEKRVYLMRDKGLGLLVNNVDPNQGQSSLMQY